MSGSERALLHEVGSLRRQVDQLVRIDPAQDEVRELYESAYYSLQEIGERMERYAAGIEHDPRRLDEIRRRQDLVFRLKTKYGQTLDEVLEVGSRARAELDLLDNAEWELGALQKKLAAAEAELAAAAAELTAAREVAMARLSGEVSAVLPELGMSGGAVFRAERIPLAEAGPFGAEEVEFRVSLNRGFEPRPLSYVASGGEMSRIMLAIKTILARLDSVPTLVFDEVDAGIGGRVALQVGEKMRDVAGTHQVFAITHLPQIASRAHVHLLVRKGERDGRTTTDVLPLEARRPRARDRADAGRRPGERGVAGARARAAGARRRRVARQLEACLPLAPNNILDGGIRTFILDILPHSLLPLMDLPSWQTP